MSNNKVLRVLYNGLIEQEEENDRTKLDFSNIDADTVIKNIHEILSGKAMYLSNEISLEVKYLSPYSFTISYKLKTTNISYEVLDITGYGYDPDKGDIPYGYDPDKGGIPKMIPASTMTYSHGISDVDDKILKLLYPTYNFKKGIAIVMYESKTGDKICSKCGKPDIPGKEFEHLNCEIKIINKLPKNTIPVYDFTGFLGALNFIQMYDIINTMMVYYKQISPTTSNKFEEISNQIENIMSEYKEIKE